MTYAATDAIPAAPTAVTLAGQLARMKEAQRKHGVPSYPQRVASLERLERAMLDRKEAALAAISRDFGNRSFHETLFAELFVVQATIRYTKAHLREWMEPEEREVSWVFLPGSAQVIPQPVGVVGIIAPWNYPLQLALVPLVSALAAGNRAMIKPSELVPATAAVLADVIAQAFSDEEVSVVTGGADVGEAFSRLPFDHLFFTGSTRVGKLVMRAASENLVPVTLELGGKSPAILGTDFPPHAAAQRILSGKLFNAGQTCIAPDYVLVPEAARDAFVEGCQAAVAQMYPTYRDNADYTAIITDEALRRLRERAEDAKARGARLVELNPGRDDLQGTRKMPAVLVLDPTEDMLVLKEEIFGPILPVITYASIDKAIAHVNDRPRPLALYYFGYDRAVVDRVLSETMSGGVTINEAALHFFQDDLPFGGIGASGTGHYHGREGFDTFTKKRPVFRQARINARGLLRPPYGKAADALLRFLVGK